MINHQGLLHTLPSSQQRSLAADVFVAIEVERPGQMSTVPPPPTTRFNARA
jgi:hypothetical protein